jgi:radical SAM protein with 4Fe4S-binding SPASM domain
VLRLKEQEQTQGKGSVPIEVTTGWINLNTGCNNRCRWCYRHDDLAIQPETMPFGKATQLVDFFAKLGVYSLILIGGEPTLYRDLVALVRQAKERGIREVTVVSNGRLMKKMELVDALADAGLDIFSVSVHSAFQEIHDQIAQVPSWEETVAGISNVIARGKSCSLNVVVGSDNIRTTVASLPIMLGWGMKQVIVSCAIPRLSRGGVDGSDALDPQQFAALIEEIKDISPKIVILHELPLCLIERETFLRLAKENRLGYGCHIGVGRGVAVDVDGNVIPCNSFPHYPVISLFEGEKLCLTPDEFLGRWAKDNAVLEMRQEANVYRSEICRRCDLWDLCNCGCPLTWGYFDPEDCISEGLLGISKEGIMSLIP